MTWEVLRETGDDQRTRLNVFDDRVTALAEVLVLQSGPDAEQGYSVAGPSEPACRTNRDLYQRLVAAGEQMDASGRSLEAFLRSWWLIGRTLAQSSTFDLDTVAAMIAAAATVEPPPLDPTWRMASYPYVDEPSCHADWEAIVLSQIADLADFADAGPLPEYAYFGCSAPRAEGCRRATDLGWYNFDPSTYLECGMSGSLGGWDEHDGLRKPVPGPVTLLRPAPEAGAHAVETLDWADLGRLAQCGQEYE